MAGTSNEIDANFFKLIHQLVSSSPQEASHERRQSPRALFESSQRIAPWDGGRFPEDAEFFAVRCHDLTRAGFSFLMPGEPPFAMLVAAFGRPPDETYVAAEVAHTEYVLLYPSGRVERPEYGDVGVEGAKPQAEPATRMILVGCRFARRLRKPALWQ